MKIQQKLILFLAQVENIEKFIPYLRSRLVPRAFITVFRLFTKDEWFEIKAQMYTLKISPWIIDIYIISWLFFGGYVLNPLLVGAMVRTDISSVM